MPRYRVILFDLDDTIIDFKKSENISLRKCYARYFYHLVSWKAFHSHYIGINQTLWKMAEEGKLGTSKIGELRFQQLANLYRIPFTMNITTFYEQALIDHSDWNEGAEHLLNTLKDLSLAIGFITNGFTHMQRGKYKKLGLSRFSEVMIVSEECGVAKPHPTIFHHALNLLNAEPYETLMIGDSLTSDGIGAKNLNIPFCWYNKECHPSPTNWNPEMTIHSLKEVIGLLQET